MKNLTQLIHKHRNRPDELLIALSALTPGELLRGLLDLLRTRRLRLHSRKRTRPLCERFYAYDTVHPHVADWFLSAARALKREQCREHYGIGALLEKIRWDERLGIIKTDGFRISNDFQACYVRQVLMRDPSLCGIFELQRTCNADPLVVDGRSWTDFAKEHEAELWPEATDKKASANDAHTELPLRATE